MKINLRTLYMEYLTFVLYTVIFIICIVPIAIFIFDFFDVPFEEYGNYLLWFVALALFNALLPFKQNNIFEELIKKN
jgi:hypothetical protein